MDEIEAALDEANVTRYVQYMRRLAKSTQFLVITHRRGTMEEADPPVRRDHAGKRRVAHHRALAG